jgi:5'(3')-deoxyribonucleotidase
MRILVDMDCIVADFFGGLFKSYYKKTGEKLVIDQITQWDMTNCVNHPDVLMDCFKKRGFFRNLKPLDGAIEYLEKLQLQGHEVLIVSTPCTPHSAAEKIEWCTEHLPLISYKNVWLGHRKYQIPGDVLIDDNPSTAQEYRNHYPDSLILTIAYPYNKTGAYNLRACRGQALGLSYLDWLEIYTAIESFRI